MKLPFQNEFGGFHKTPVLAAAALALVISACGSSSATASSTSSTAASSGGTSKPSGSPINVGVVAGFTGTTAFIGKTFLTGATTAETLINENGGVLGRPIKLIPEDDGFDPVDAVTVVRKMLAVDNVSAVLGLAAPDYANALPILNAAHMVNFTHIGSPSLDTQLMPYSFRSQPSDAVVGTAMAYYASLHYKKVALALDASSGAQTLHQPILNALKKTNVQLTADVTLPVTAGSYTSEVLQILAGHPDAILMQATDPSEFGEFFTALRQEGGGTIPVIASDLSAAADMVKAAGASYDQQYIKSIVPASAGGPGQATFLAEFQKLYNKGPQSVAPNMYDSLNVVALAMDAAGSTDPTKYVSFIPKVTTPGPGVTTVYTYAQGYKLLQEHKAIKYSGVASPDTFTKYHTVAGAFSAVTTDAAGKETVVQTLDANALTNLLS